MGREISNHVNVTVVTQQHSSIALLQERFRELQRVKALREQREVLKLLAPNSETFHNHHYSDLQRVKYEPSAAPRLFFHPNSDHHHHLHHEHVQLPQESISPSRISLSLWPTLDLELQKESKHDDHEDDSVRRKSNTSEIPLLINLWPEVTSDTSSSSDSSSVETCSSDKLFETATYSDSDSDDVDTSLHL